MQHKNQSFAEDMNTRVHLDLTQYMTIETVLTLSLIWFDAKQSLKNSACHNLFSFALHIWAPSES